MKKMWNGIPGRGNSLCKRPGSHEPVRSTWGAACVLGESGFVGGKPQAWSGGRGALDAPVPEGGVRALGAEAGGGAHLQRCPTLLSSSAWGQSAAAQPPGTPVHGRDRKAEQTRTCQKQSSEETRAPSQHPALSTWNDLMVNPMPERWGNLEESGKVLF